MDTSLFSSLGLNDTQALVYKTLLDKGPLAPPAVADLAGIKRQNAYAVLDQLVSLELVVKKDIKKKLIYQAQHPVALEKIARKRQAEAENSQKLLTAQMPSLLKVFYSTTERPGVHFYQGIEEIEAIYDDMLHTKDTVYVIRSVHDSELLSTDFYKEFKKKKVRLGIKTVMLNPEHDPTIWNEDTDKQFLTQRTQIDMNDYSAPVEISVYGDKVAIISFGNEAIGTVITSPQISIAMRQLVLLVKDTCDSK